MAKSQFDVSMIKRNKILREVHEHQKLFPAIERLYLVRKEAPSWIA